MTHHCPPCRSQRRPGALISTVQRQCLRQMSHCLPRIIHHRSPFNPGLRVGRLDLQGRSKVAPGASTLPDPRSLQTPLHQHGDPWVTHSLSDAILHQQIESFLADQTGL
jgi:hypothetical protein